MSSPSKSLALKRYQPQLLRWMAACLLLNNLFLAPAVWSQVNSNNTLNDGFNNRATLEYQDIEDNPRTYHVISNDLSVAPKEGLLDPGGQILDCDGSRLPSYSGFSVGLYEPDASGLDLGNLVSLTQTEVPDIPNNGIPSGITPNRENANPFSLSDSDEGRYNYLFDPTRNLNSVINAGLQETDVGAKYILVVNPPSTSAYSQRRVGITIGTSTLDPISNKLILTYRATALDGQPISADGRTEVTDTLEIQNAEAQTLNLFSLALGMSLCQPNQIQITKTADRAAAQPGDTVVYRLSIRNLVNVPLTEIVAHDVLPSGFQLIPESVYGQINSQTIAVQAESNSSNVTFSVLSALPQEQSLDILYAVRITPDALRGSGQNIADVSAERIDNGLFVQDGPSIHRLVVDPGIVSDCATLIGRVFVDKNFDGEQQPGEPGIPDAVIFLDDGNRIVTDTDGRYSVSCLLPGNRSGVLDLSSLPDYTLAPNLYFKERNSQSRIVELAPGSLARMNFGVTPTFRGEAE